MTIHRPIRARPPHFFPAPTACANFVGVSGIAPVPGSTLPGSTLPGSGSATLFSAISVLVFAFASIFCWAVVWAESMTSFRTGSRCETTSCVICRESFASLSWSSIFLASSTLPRARAAFSAMRARFASSLSERSCATSRALLPVSRHCFWNSAIASAFWAGVLPKRSRTFPRLLPFRRPSTWLLNRGSSSSPAISEALDTLLPAVCQSVPCFPMVAPESLSFFRLSITAPAGSRTPIIPSEV